MRKTIKIITVKPVKKGEELSIKCNGKFEDKTLVWFDKNNLNMYV